MQTATHLTIGSCLGAMCLPQEFLPPIAYLPIAACALGSILPDTPMILAFGLDKLAGRPPMKEQAPWALYSKSVFQSIFLWIAVFLLGLWQARTSGFDTTSVSILALGIAGVLHVIIDIFTHGDPQFHALDGWYGAPFAPLRHVGWDYRMRAGQLWPLKPFEAIVFWATLFETPLIWFVRVH